MRAIRRVGIDRVRDQTVNRPAGSRVLALERVRNLPESKGTYQLAVLIDADDQSTLAARRLLIFFNGEEVPKSAVYLASVAWERTLHLYEVTVGLEWPAPGIGHGSQKKETGTDARDSKNC